MEVASHCLFCESLEAARPPEDKVHKVPTPSEGAARDMGEAVGHQMLHVEAGDRSILKSPQNMSGSDTGEGEISGEDGRTGRVPTAEV